MSTLPERFIITYLLAFALLWGVGVFAAKRSSDRGWSPWFSRVHVYILRAEGDGPNEFLVINDAMGSDAPDPDYTPGVSARQLGRVSLSMSEHIGVAAPFVRGIGQSANGLYELYYAEDLAPDDLANAKSMALRETRLSFDTPFSAVDEIDFFERDWPSSTYRPEVKPHGLKASMPWWALISLFAFAPLAAAWTVTAATSRRKPTRDSPSPLEGEGGLVRIQHKTG